MLRTALVTALVLLATAPAAALADGHASTVQILSPTAGATYRDGQPVALKGSGGDETTLSWKVVRGDGTQVASAEGQEASFTPADDLGPDAELSITLTATDEHGHAASVTRAVRPELTTLSLSSDPAGAPLPWTTATFAVGQRVALQAAGEYAANGCRLTFAGWSDGGAQSHVISAPAGPATLVAHYAQAECAATGDGVTGAGLGGRGPAVDISAPVIPTRVLSGTVEDPDGVMFVKVALRRAGGGLGCRWWSSRARRFQRARTSCARPHWMTARVTGSRWRLDLGARLRPGRYILVFRSADRAGVVAQGLSDGIASVPVSLVALPR